VPPCSPSSAALTPTREGPGRDRWKRVSSPGPRGAYPGRDSKHASVFPKGAGTLWLSLRLREQNRPQAEEDFAAPVELVDHVAIRSAES
jgi:hypothetical protein